MRPSRRNHRHACVSLAVAASTLLAGGAAAQVYRCGSSFQSVPCNSRSPRMVQAGGMPSYGPAVRSLPGIEAPPSYYEHLSGRCKELNDALRTSHIRGVGSEAMRGVFSQWQQECAVDAALAMKQEQQERNEALNGELAARQAAEEAKLRPQRERARCDEMALALSDKEHRASHSAGEQADLARFKENYNARCVRR